MTTATIASRAMLVDLTIRQWAAVKIDKAVGREVAAQHGSEEQMGHYTKHLVAKANLEAIQKLGRKIETEHRRRTFAWSDRGPRVLPSAGYFDYRQAIGAFRPDWDSLVSTIVRDYDRIRLDAKWRLNGLYRDADYPDDISDRFTFAYAVLPFPTAEDFRIDLGNAETDRLRQELESTTRAVLQASLEDIANRITATVGRMAERLRAYAVTDAGASGIFRDSLVSNVKDLVELLPSLNLTQDARLTDITQRMRRELCAVSPDALRASEPARMQVAKAAEAILQDMSAFI